MKKCPYCDAAIEENARFCLYCMRELEKKAIITSKPAFKYKRILLSAVILLIFVAGISFFLICKHNKNLSVNTSVFSNSSSTEESKSGNPAFKENYSAASDTSIGKSIKKKENSAVSDSGIVQSSAAESHFDENRKPAEESKKNQSTQSSQTSHTVQNSSKANKQVSSAFKNSSVTSADNGKTDVSLPSESESKKTSEHTAVTYSYQTAPSFGWWGFSDLDTEIMISGVETTASDGVYIVPEVIDGKKVIAIGYKAFSGANIATGVKKVVLPNTVKSICQGAFRDCNNITDIYIMSEKLEIEGGAIAPPYIRNFTSTFHSSKTCKEHGGELLGEFVDSEYGAKWKEWNKVIDF